MGRIVIGAIVLSFFSVLGISSAQGQESKPSSLAELAAYTGADREQILLAGAKKEGKVVWYTSLAGGSYKELAASFEAKYPGIRVEAYRASSEDLGARLLAEALAKRHIADAIESTLALLKAMRDNKLLIPFYSPHLAKYPEESKERAEKGLFFWVIARESYMGFAYNKKSIPGSAVPKSYEDLLRPELKGKMSFVTTETGTKTVASLLKFKGEEFLKKLKNQEISLYAISGRALLDLIISGEVSASPTIFRNHALVSIGQGAPVEWVPMEVVPTNAGGATVAAGAPHPYAGVLFTDFILGSEGQKILEKFKYGSASKDYGFKRWYPERGLSTDQYDRESSKWEKILRDLGRK